MTTPLHLAVALDGAGWHPAAWRAADARPAELFEPGYWTDLVREAESGLLDWVTIEDPLGMQTAAFHRADDPATERVDQVRGSLDALLLAAFVAPSTSRIGVVPTVNVTHTEPFHLAVGLATLDFASKGRAGWRPQISSRAADAGLFGRRTTPQLTDTDVLDPELIAARLSPLFAEATEVVEAVRRLWDSWQDDAEIRDVASGRFLDADRVHHVDFVGSTFSVKGPSIVPRSPQGQPLVTSLSHASVPDRFAAGSADVVYLTPRDRDDVDRVRTRFDAAQELIARPGLDAPRVFADLVVFVDDEPGAAARRRAELDELAGAPLTSDAAIFAGTSDELADLLLEWQTGGLDGFRLRPAALPHDLTGITRCLVPHLQRRDAFSTAYDADTLRGHLGLDRPRSRYAPR